MFTVAETIKLGWLPTGRCFTIQTRFKLVDEPKRTGIRFSQRLLFDNIDEETKFCDLDFFFLQQLYGLLVFFGPDFVVVYFLSSIFVLSLHCSPSSAGEKKLNSYSLQRLKNSSKLSSIFTTSS